MRFFLGSCRTYRRPHDRGTSQQVGKEPAPSRHELFERIVVHQAFAEAVEHVLRIFGLQISHQLVDRLFGQVDLQMLELALEDLPPVAGRFAHILVQGSLDLVARPGGLDKFEPLRLRLLVLAGDDLHLVAALQDVVQRHQRTVHLCPQAARADGAVDRESEVERCRPFGQAAQIAFGGEDEDLAHQQVQFELIDQVGRIHFRLFQGIAHFGDPFVHVFVRRLAGVFVFVVGRIALFGQFVHPFGADLHLHPAVFGPHHGNVQRLVAGRFRSGDPVAQAARVGVEFVRNDRVDLPGAELFLFLGAFVDDADRKTVVHLVEAHPLVDHLFVDGVDGLVASGDGVVQVFAVQHVLDLGDKTGNVRLLRLIRLAQQPDNVLVGLRLGVLEREVLHLRLDVVQPQPVCQRSVDVECF